MSERLEKFKQIELLNQVNGFCEALEQAEITFGKQVKNNFTFSQKEYNVFGVTKFWLGKIGDWYYVGKENENSPENEFKFFENKKLIQIYLTREFEGLPVEQKGFWMREVEIF